MKTKILMGGLLAFILTLCFACNQKKDDKGTDKDQVKTEIQAIEDHFAWAYNNRNLDSLTYYADDAVSYFAGEMPIVGKAAIHNHIANELKDFPQGAKVSFETIEVYVTGDGNNAAEIGEFKVDAAGKLLSHGHYFSFFVKRNGKFVCTRDMTNSAPLDSLK
jgi:ketosteroid isomerase-like protein